MKKRYYPAPELDMAIHHLQNHPELRGVNPRQLEAVEVWDGRTVGRHSWERAKRLLANTTEERHVVTVDTANLMVTYIGATSRLVGKANSRKRLLKRIEVIQTTGKYKHVFTNTDKTFYVYALDESEVRLTA